MGVCKCCKFRLYVDNRRFHCAANRNGWAYLSDMKRPETMPFECGKRIEGDGMHVGRELPHVEFWQVAGGRISEDDWLTFRTRGVKV